MDQQTAHHIEELEAELRQFRQALRNLADAVLAGSERTELFAQQAKEMLGES